MLTYGPPKGLHVVPGSEKTVHHQPGNARSAWAPQYLRVCIHLACHETPVWPRVALAHEVYWRKLALEGRGYDLQAFGIDWEAEHCAALKGSAV